MNSLFLHFFPQIATNRLAFDKVGFLLYGLFLSSSCVRLLLIHFHLSFRVVAHVYMYAVASVVLPISLSVPVACFDFV